jgi:hypothetical protein
MPNILSKFQMKIKLSLQPYHFTKFGGVVSMITLRFVYLVFVIFICCSCEKKTKTKLELIKSQSIVFNTPYNNIVSLSSSTFENYINYATIEDKKINLLNLINNKIEYKISLDKIDSVASIKNGFSFYFHNFDTIFVLLEKKVNTIYQIDSTGKITKKYFFSVESDYNYVLTSFGGSNMCFFDNKILLKKMIFPQQKNSDYLKIFYSEPPDITINTKNNVVEKFGQWPLKYTYENFNNSYPYRCIDNEKNVIYSFAAEHELYVYSKNGQLSTFPAKSKFIDKFIQYDIDSMYNVQFKKKYFTTAPKYAKIIFDMYNNLYYRIAIHEQSFINKKTNTINSEDDKTWSIIILDKQFNLIDEIYFSENSPYTPFSFSICEEGLLIRKKKKINNNNENYTWDLDLFKLKIENEH